MKITPIKTHKITPNDNFYKVLDGYVKTLSEKSILAITSKIISITQKRLVKIGSVDKNELIKQEADFFLPKEKSKYNFFLTIKNGLLIPSSGIDESNVGGYYVLWPKNPQEMANSIRRYLRKKFFLKHVGLVVTDSRTTPLRWGVTGVAIAYSGFEPLRDYIGTLDIFGREFKATKVNVMDGLAAACVFVMGEGKEQTPLAVIEEAGNVVFKKSDPTEKELASLNIALEDDLYAPILKSVKWEKGGSGRR